MPAIHILFQCLFRETGGLSKQPAELIAQIEADG